MKASVLLKKAIKLNRQGTLIPAVKLRAVPYLQGLKYTLRDCAGDSVVLHCPTYTKASTNRDEMEIVNRIFQSFKRMKEDQKKVSALYLPSSVWQDQLDTSYSYFADALRENDPSKFHFFLSNFGTWRQYHGVESNTLIRDYIGSFVGRRYLKNVKFYNPLKTWQWNYNNRKQLSELTYPQHGNQAGAYINGEFVGMGSFFNEIYGSTLSELLDDIERPVVADLGAGYGKLAYFTLRGNSDFCFIDFDLPETLCLAAYYLIKTWPDKRVLLYGEGDYSGQAHSRYDLIFMPSFEIERIPDDSVDLFINKNSLGEMTSNAVANYIHYIATSTRYFFHMNHDITPNVYSDDSKGLLGHEYPIPSDKFKLLFRGPDMAILSGQPTSDYYGTDIFLYLYERRK